MSSEVVRPPPPQTFHATLISSRDVTPRVKELVFERVDGDFVFQSGQWVSLVLPITDERGRSSLAEVSPAPLDEPVAEPLVLAPAGAPVSASMRREASAESIRPAARSSSIGVRSGVLISQM